LEACLADASALLELEVVGEVLVEVGHGVILLVERV
jgi:hypothetical protein